MSQVDHVLTVQNQLGEGPIWSPDEQALYWVDILKHRVYRFYPATGKQETFEMALPVTVLAGRDSGGLVIATANGFAFWDPATQALDFIADPEADRSEVRFNDGAVDPQGRFWAGTMNEENPDAPDGCLYRLDADLSVHKMEEGITVSNGMGWSPDHQTLYFTDTFRYLILVYDYDPATGAISNRRPFVQVPQEEGLPDGLTVDSEGFVWSAHWGGWRVTRYDPTGKVERVIQMPVPNATSCAFGGDNLDELYITTAWAGMSEEERKNRPFAGDLFRVNVGVKGVKEPKFIG
jgi:sugar lactone lactonase YvrE